MVPFVLHTIGTLQLRQTNREREATRGSSMEKAAPDVDDVDEGLGDLNRKCGEYPQICDE